MKPAVPSRHSSQLELDCGSAADAQAVLAAIGLELAEGPEGCSAEARLDGGRLHVTVEAGDAGGLRAALNSIVRLTDAAARTSQGKP